MPDQQGFGGPPGAPSPGTGFPENTGFIAFEVFETLNTKPTRPAIQDSEMFICDGFMPFGPSNLRVLPDVGAKIYTAPNGRTITAMWFYNLAPQNSGASTTYMAVLLNDGSMLQINLGTGASTTIMPPGTITAPNPDNTGTTQWNSKYLVVVSTQDNGYWIWDGTHLYTAGGVSPEVDITNSGKNYTGTPTFNFQTTAAVGYVVPTFSVTIEDGFVTQAFVTSPGSGFAVDDLINVSLAGGGSDTTAIAQVNISSTSGPVIAVQYTGDATSVGASAYVVIAPNPAGKHATAALTVSDQTVQSITVTNGQGGYTSSPAVTFDNTGSITGTLSAVAQIGYGEIPIGNSTTSPVGGIVVTNPGTNYTSPPTVTIIGDGQGAQAFATIDNTGVVTDITVTNGGYGYTKALAVLNGGNNAAELSIDLMPFGVQGTTVETFVNRVWVGDTRRAFFTSPSSVSDFKPSDGAGVFAAYDSFQRVAYSSFKQTNGFLYLVSDSSINYIGGVQTTGSPATTIFNNLNVDPQIGTPWPSTVQLFSRNIVFANSFGVFVSYGGAVQKISAPLDGIYNTVITPGAATPPIFPSSAIASLFGIAVYMLLFPIIDQVTGQQTNKLLIWDGKRWWTSSQSVPLTYVASQEVDSVLIAWGTDGSSVYPLFQSPSVNFTKTAQSKLWANPSYWFRKTNPYIAGLVNFFNADGDFTITVDNETNDQTVVIDAFSTGTVTWTNNAGNTVVWTNNSSQVVSWLAPGLALVGPQTVGAVGTLLGMTISTTGSDLSVLSLSLGLQNYQSKV